MEDGEGDLERLSPVRARLLVQPVLPRFVAIRPCGNVRSNRLQQPRCAPISIRSPVLFSLYTITSQFAAKCPSNFLTARNPTHRSLNGNSVDLFTCSRCSWRVVEADGAKLCL